ncbi:MAG: hypothetical protein KAV00_09700 [Phycisphaerae bacterium]|nr:hypothetical protein [Phycisphaerae bacterium]
MTGKLRIIVLAGIGIVGFGGAYLASSMFGPKKQATTQPAGEAKDQPEDLADLPEAMPGQSISNAKREAELTGLIREVRLKIRDCRKKTDDLEKREKRVRIAGEMLKKQAEELEALRMQLVSPLTRIREAIAELESTRVRIAKTEQSNMKRIATMCEKMDSANGSQMLIGMCQNNQEDDAVKILYYMSERSAGKLLAEITDKTLAAKLCGKLKKVQEKG